MAELMLTVTQKEAVELELEGARSRLARVLHELELFHGRRDHSDSTYISLLTEYDEASRAVMLAREKVDEL
jgi:hypothetical protein